MRIAELAATATENLPVPRKVSCLRDIFLPFCQVVAHDSVLSSLVLEASVGTIYNVIFGINGRRALALFGFYASALQDVKLIDGEQGLWQASLSPALTVLAKVIDINQTACVIEGFQAIVQSITACIDEPNKGLQRDLDFQAAIRSLERARARLGLGSLIPSRQNKQNNLTNVPVVFELETRLPGQLAQGGPRHDNDHADISDIKILPTTAEISSCAQEYLPVLDLLKLHRPGILGLVDQHFRLVREDNIGPLRDAARSVAKVLSGSEHNQSAIERGQQGARVIIYTAVSLQDFAFDKRRGPFITVEFDQPSPVAKAATETGRAHYWLDSKRLQKDSLLCLVDSQGGAIFLSVFDRDVKYEPQNPAVATEPSANPPVSLWSHQRRASIKLRTIDYEESDIQQILRQFDIQSSVRQVLVEFPGVLLPSFRPTLQTLQLMSRHQDVPFSDYLAHPEDGSQLTSADIQPPAYSLQPGFRFHLKSILNKGTLTLSPGDAFDVEALMQSSTLDSTQSAALVHALTSRLALIQGPPGTGKSYIGIKIVKVLLANRITARLGPIICV